MPVVFCRTHFETVCDRIAMADPLDIWRFHQALLSGPKRTKRIATDDKEAFHKLRHTAATRFDTVKATKAQQKAIMGHSPGDVTEGYVHPPLTELRTVLVAAEREMLRWAAEKEARSATKRTGH